MEYFNLIQFNDEYRGQGASEREREKERKKHSQNSVGHRRYLGTWLDEEVGKRR